MRSRLPVTIAAIALAACSSEEVGSDSVHDAGLATATGTSTGTDTAGGPTGATGSSSGTSSGSTTSSASSGQTGGGATSGGATGGGATSGGATSDSATGGGNGSVTSSSGGASHDASADRLSGEAGTTNPPGDAAGCRFRMCETFENTADDAIPTDWQKAAGAGTIGVVSTMANRGSKSLHVIAPSGSYETYIRHTKSFPLPDNSFYGRVFFRIAQRRSAPDKILHWNLVEARGSSSNTRIRYGGIENSYGPTNAFLFNDETQGSGEKGIDDGSDVQVNPGKWYCVEWLFKGTAGSNEARLWVDGAERTKVHASGSTFDGLYAMPTFNALYIGWAIYQPMDGPYEVWIDDVAIDTQKIDCDR